jgi:hypothetical protein
LSRKCEYCGKHFSEGEDWFGYFRHESHPEGTFHNYKYFFCCRGHYDSFCNQTSMTKVNNNGRTNAEQEIQNRINFGKTHSDCNQCGAVCEKRLMLRSHDLLFCSQTCLNKFILRECDECGKQYDYYNKGLSSNDLHFCDQKCLKKYFTELQSSIDLISGKWRGGDPYELEFRKVGCGFNGFFALCTKENPNDKPNNAFKENQMLFKDVEFLNISTIIGQILVPIQSGDQKWFNFTGTIENGEMSVEIGDANWGWGYKKLFLTIKAKDELFDNAARLVVQHKQGTRSLLMRKMQLDWDRATKIIEQLEFAGIIGSIEDKSMAPEVKFTDLNTLEDYLKGIGNG